MLQKRIHYQIQVFWHRSESALSERQIKRKLLTSKREVVRRTKSRSVLLKQAIIPNQPLELTRQPRRTLNECEVCTVKLDTRIPPGLKRTDRAIKVCESTWLPGLYSMTHNKPFAELVGDGALVQLTEAGGVGGVLASWTFALSGKIGQKNGQWNRNVPEWKQALIAARKPKRGPRPKPRN